jgi:hypothetical protein
MNVYSISFHLATDAELRKAEGVVANWISQKARRLISDAELWETPDRTFDGGMRLDAWIAGDGIPMARALRLSHPDTRVLGRQWVTEIGFRENEPGKTQMTLLLRTEEASAQVSTPVQVSRPKLVTDLVASCSFASFVPGDQVRTLSDADSASALRYAVDDDSRSYALVVISAAHNGKYLVDVERVKSLVVGIAEVVVIPPDARTYEIGDVLGNQFRSWLGAVNVIFPVTRGARSTLAPNRKLFPEQIEEIRANGGSVETEILSLVTQRTNILNARQHISPELVHSLSARRAIEQSQRHAAETGERAQYVSLLERELSDLEDKLKNQRQVNEDLEEAVFNAELRNEESESALGQLRFEHEALKLTMRSIGTKNASVDFSAIRAGVLALSKGDAKPEQLLRIVAALYPDRLVVLESAWKAATDAADFDEPNRMFSLLMSLANEYWSVMVSGKGDAEARKVFGDAYSARESESVENNRRARELRTFEYKCVLTEMMRHVRIGVKDSAAKTMRIHFDWDPTENVIVIGHCGRHLDHN